jgi:hypothetical protein
VTRGFDAAPAAARIRPVAASAIRPSEKTGTNPDPRLQITGSMIVLIICAGQKLLAAAGVTAGGGHCCTAVLHGKGWDSGCRASLGSTRN